MRTYEYGLAITDNLTEQFTENLTTQIQLIWKTMWFKNEIKGRSNFTITYHGSSLTYGYISFNLCNHIVDVAVQYVRGEERDIDKVFNCEEKRVELHGLKDLFSINIFKVGGLFGESNA